jgi:stearoyl-CoA desaturase (Delta-9 desaturase)
MLLGVLVAFGVALLFTQLSTFSTTIFLHRTMAHKGLKLNPLVSFLMQLELWLYTGIVTREWVAVHRKHHHFSDVEGDPHSPYLKGLWRVLLWNAIYYAREANKAETIEKYTRDMPRKASELLFSRGGVGLLVGLGTFVAGYSYFIHHWWGPVVGIAMFVFQGLVYIVLNALINGACHMVGYRNFKNTATNIRIVAWLTGGEGLHNNHHQYPAASKFSMNRKRWEFDPAWVVIKVLEAVKLAKPLPLPKIQLPSLPNSEEQVAAITVTA